MDNGMILCYYRLLGQWGPGFSLPVCQPEPHKSVNDLPLLNDP
jgi:hypothetical protein